MKRIFSVLFLLTAFISAAMAQQEITGIVTDETNEPLPGATVIVKGTSVGAATDLDGKFTIKAKKGDVLNIAYVGYNNK